MAASAQQPKPAAGNDAAIERAIRARFARSKIAADKFEVRVQGGVATITGRTDVVQRKGVATRLAKLGGARRVDNQVQISEAARQRAAANLEKHRRSGAKGRSEAGPKRAAVVQPG
jgi:hypothetical protein